MGVSFLLLFNVVSDPEQIFLIILWWKIEFGFENSVGWWI